MSTMIPIDRIRPRRTNRNIKKTDPEIKELAKSIESVGLLQPIGVVEAEKDMYDVVFGHRRLVAMQVLGEPTIEAQVFPKGPLNEDILAMSVNENVHRVDLDPIQELEELKLMAKSMTAEEICALLGKPLSYFYRRMQLDNLTDAWKQKLNEYEIPALRLEEIARLPHDIQTELWEHWDNWGFEHACACPLKEFRETLMEHMDLVLPARWPMDDDTLLPSAGSCLECPKRTGANPDLWGDTDFKVGKNERCMDRDCYHTKFSRYTFAKVDELRAKHPTLPVIVRSASNSITDVLKEMTGVVLIADNRVIDSTKSKPDSFQGYNLTTDKIEWFSSWDKAVLTHPQLVKIIKNPSAPAVKEAKKKTEKAEASGETTAKGAPKQTLKEKMRLKIMGMWRTILGTTFKEMVENEFDAAKHLPGWDTYAGLTSWVAAFGLPWKDDNACDKQPWINGFRGFKGDGLVLRPYMEDEAPLRVLPHKKQNDYEVRRVGVATASDWLAHGVKQIILERIHLFTGTSSSEMARYLPDMIFIADCMDKKLGELFDKEMAGFKPPSSWQTQLPKGSTVEEQWNKVWWEIIQEATKIVIPATNPESSSKPKRDKPAQGAKKPRARKKKAAVAAK